MHKFLFIDFLFLWENFVFIKKIWENTQAKIVHKKDQRITKKTLEIAA